MSVAARGPALKLSENMRNLLMRIDDDWGAYPRYCDHATMKALKRRGLVESGGPGGAIRKTEAGRAVFA